MDTPDTPEILYLDLLKKTLTRTLFPEIWEAFDLPRGSLKWALAAPIQKLLNCVSLQLVWRAPLHQERCAEGHGWPVNAETMIGLRRLDNLQQCITDIIRQRVPGDLLEAGAWRGGATIFMRAVLKVYGETGRTVWVADSFRGLPKPNEEKYPKDSGIYLWAFKHLAVSVDDVKQNFAKYGLLDGEVRFLVGWFRDTLPTAPIERLALLRLDGDLYESTMDTLRALYAKVSNGGYVIVDDYFSVDTCRAAVDDFRAEHKITEEIKPIDWAGGFWQRLR